MTPPSKAPSVRRTAGADGARERTCRGPASLRTVGGDVTRQAVTSALGGCTYSGCCSSTAKVSRLIPSLARRALSSTHATFVLPLRGTRDNTVLTTYYPHTVLPFFHCLLGHEHPLCGRDCASHGSAAAAPGASLCCQANSRDSDFSSAPHAGVSTPSLSSHGYNPTSQNYCFIGRWQSDACRGQ